MLISLNFDGYTLDCTLNMTIETLLGRGLFIYLNIIYLNNKCYFFRTYSVPNVEAFMRVQAFYDSF